MKVQLEATEVLQEVETGVQHQRFRFDGSGVTFDADGLEVQAGSWILGIDQDRQGDLLAITLDLADLDGRNLKRLDEAVELPENAMSSQGADVVRLHMRERVLADTVKPLADKIGSLPDLLQIKDEFGRSVIFRLTNFELTDLAPAEG